MRQVWSEPAEQKALPYFRSNLRWHLASVAGPLDLTQALVRAARESTPSARARGVTLKLDLLAPLTSRGDKRLLEQSVGRLLALVVEHAKAGTTVTCSAGLSEDRGAVISIIADCAPRSRQLLALRLSPLEQIVGAAVEDPLARPHSFWRARLIIEAHLGRVQAVFCHGTRAGIEISLPAALE
jgi:signal transduction histidine kinase